MLKNKIVVAGTGYVGLSIAALLSQHNKVTAVDVIKEKVDLINNKVSPILDTEISEYLSNKDLVALTLEDKAAISRAITLLQKKEIINCQVKKYNGKREIN